jgi:hypothetical protein
MEETRGEGQNFSEAVTPKKKKKKQKNICDRLKAVVVPKCWGVTYA